MPINILNFVLYLIPFVGFLAAMALGIYNIVLQVFMVMAVHRMSGGRATLVVLFPAIVAVVLGCVLFFVILAAVSHTSPQ